jgi:hypothetical protein
MVEGISTKTLIRCLGWGVSLVIGKSVETIGDGCFQRNETLKSIAFEPASVLQQIGESAFATRQGNAMQLKWTVTLPRSDRVLSNWCFAWCALLEMVTFESGSVLWEIGESGFGNIGLKCIHSPASVEVMGESAFIFCQFLSSVWFEFFSVLWEIGNCTFFDRIALH